MVYSPLLLPASCLREQGRLERASGIPCQPPPQQHGQGVTLSVPLPHWGGLRRTSRSLPIGRAGLGRGPGRPGRALLRPDGGLQAAGIFPSGGHPPAPGEAPGAHRAWHLSAGLGALFTASHRCGDGSLGEGGAGAGDWRSEALGSACLMKERGANGDTEILIRGSLWGGIYYSVLIGCVVTSQHPGPGREPRNSQHGQALGEAALGWPQGAQAPSSPRGILRPGNAQPPSGGAGSRGSSKGPVFAFFPLVSLPWGPLTRGWSRPVAAPDAPFALRGSPAGGLRKPSERVPSMCRRWAGETEAWGDTESSPRSPSWSWV